MPCARSMSPQHPVAMAEPAMPATQTPPSASAARREIAEWRVWALSELAVFGFWLKSIGVGSGVRGSKSMSLIQASSFPVTVDSGARWDCSLWMPLMMISTSFWSPGTRASSGSGSCSILYR